MSTVQDWLPSLIILAPPIGQTRLNRAIKEATSKVHQKKAAFESLQERFGSLTERSTAEPGFDEEFQCGMEQLAEAGRELHEATEELERQTARGKELSDSLRLDIQYLKDIAEMGAGASVGADSEFERRTWRMTARLKESRAVEKACWARGSDPHAGSRDKRIGERRDGYNRH
ncbi:hypothetical protein JCM24511_06437 [Saitozyma sp. JCM 24511]|nr:hypothetical protein JCM24511_06437 [Saitozyma sp. JCM 24511]